MAEISLNASMRSNLLSLQQTQRLQDTTQSRLSTGLKVNSAIDNPSSYYTASSLNNRAEDLGALLDAMSQGIQTIKAANEALETGTAMLQQAKATAVKASESSVDIVAKVNNEAELLAAVEKGGPGYIIIENDITMTNVKLKLKDGQSLVGANYFDVGKPQTTLNFNYDNFSDNAIEAGNNSTIANLNIKTTNSFLNTTKVENAAILLSSVKNVTLKNLNINTDTSGYAGAPRGYFAIKAVASEYQINGNINIIANGDNSRSILNDYGSKLEINNAIVNSKTLGILGGVWFSILSRVSCECKRQ